MTLYVSSVYGLRVEGNQSMKRQPIKSFKVVYQNHCGSTLGRWVKAATANDAEIAAKCVSTVRNILWVETREGVVA